MSAEHDPVRQLRVVVEAADFEQALAFYRDVLGLPESAAFEGDGDARVAILEAGRATLELANPAQRAMIDRVEVGADASPRIRLAFEVGDTAAVTRRLAAAGATVIAEPVETPWRSSNARLAAPADLQITVFQELGPAAEDAEDDEDAEGDEDAEAVVAPGGLDVIGDVHGEAGQLRTLLSTMGYTESDGVFSHPDGRRAVFIGDLIDRGLEQLDCLRIARAMVASDNAYMVLGNHEFNAVAWATERAPGEYCRPHSPKNLRQHSAFLAAVAGPPSVHDEWLTWFRTIPLWLELDGLRIVHACWSPADIGVLERYLTDDRTLTDDAVRLGSDRDHELYRSLEVVLKGPEVDLDPLAYVDKGGVERTQARWSWWSAATTLREGAYIPPGARTPEGTPFPELPDTPVSGLPTRGGDLTPVIFGHYWFTGVPRPIDEWACCVDYSAGAGGPLVAYRWNPGDRGFHGRQLVRSSPLTVGSGSPAPPPDAD